MGFLYQWPLCVDHLQVIKEHIVLALVTAIYKHKPVLGSRLRRDRRVVMRFHYPTCSNFIKAATRIIELFIEEDPVDIRPGSRYRIFCTLQE